MGQSSPRVIGVAPEPPTSLQAKPAAFTCRNRGQITKMQENNSTVEILRHQFRHGEPALPLRHSARTALRSVDDHPDAPWIDDVLVVVSELVQNVSKHTRSSGELIISVQPGTVLVEVGDSSTIVPHTRRRDLLRVGGRGLLLVEAMSEQWGVRTCPQGKAVWALLSANTA
jgi:hypothetical protein